MRGLKELGSLLTSAIDGRLSRDKQKLIRKKINPSRICDWCLEGYTRQTQHGDLLCTKCYIEYRNSLIK
jgi:protein-arginine kinase activator protein McsA